MKMIKYLIGLLVFTAGFCILSCTKQDDYKKYVKDGEITYPGRVDSVIAQAGNRRINLKIALGSDPMVTKVRAYWNNRADSAEMAVVHVPGKDTVNMMISNLQEGMYNFSVYTYDSKNHISVVKNVSGSSYGVNYLESLSNRVIKSLEQSVDGNKIIINWNEPMTGEQSIELKYTDHDGVAKILTAPGGEMQTTLPSYKEKSELSFRSVYLPEEQAVDKFSVDYTKVILPLFERQMPKTGFNIKVLPTDKVTAYGWLMDYLWDEKYNPPGFATTSGPDQWFTFDMGTPVTLSRFKTWQANDRLYEKESVKKFEIWGSNDPNPDGSWASWTKLTTCESVKPSGRPLGEVSDLDVEYAEAGEQFVFPAGVPKVRYIRIKVLETWGNSDFITMEELTFWTRDR